MSFLISCPNCGLRDVSEFRYGGELLGSMAGPSSAAEWRVSNLPALQRERWYHRLGCRRWLVAERDVRTNQVTFTDWLDGNAS